MKAKNKTKNGRKKQLVTANQIVSDLTLLKGNGCHLKEKFSRQRDLASNLIQALPSFFVAIDADGRILMNPCFRLSDILQKRLRERII